VGLRPGRTRVRLEAETLDLSPLNQSKSNREVTSSSSGHSVDCTVNKDLSPVQSSSCHSKDCTSSSSSSSSEHNREHSARGTQSHTSDGVQHERARVRVVHCYGHGGAGLTLGWGCAGDVVRHVCAALEL